MLGSEYGWSLYDILNHVYYDDLVKLAQLSNVRRLREWSMQLSIVTNPHTKQPKHLFKLLEQEERKILGTSVRPAVMDIAGFEILKNQLSNNPRFVIK